MRQRISSVLLGISIVMVMLAGCDSPVGGGATATPASQGATGTPAASSGDSEAAEYCRSKGGEVVTRYPAYDAYAEKPLILAGSLDFCQFTAEDKSMIAISLDTLYTEEPTLATLAYLNKPPLAETANPSANPASVYCTKLGGSDLFGGVNAAAGGWINDDKEDTFYVLEACIFPDLSSIDSWGLTYHTGDVIRGTDLSEVIRFQPPSDSPGVFGR